MMEQDRVGQQLGNYRLSRAIGSGGYATVYLGDHIILKTQAALKVVKELELTEKQREQFLAEARLIAKLSHRHIIRVLECGVEIAVDGSIPYIVMSYASAGNVRKKYPHGTQVPFNVVISYVNQIAEALDYAHRQNIVHCDVKPENMLLSETNQILLSDFGIAGSSHTEILDRPDLMSQPTNIPGTPFYMAPERFQGYRRRATDQYALAIVVYEWLTGQPPFVGNVERVMYQHMSVPPPSLCAKNPLVPQKVEQVVMRALEKEPDQRFPEIKEFAHALEEAFRESQQSIIPPPDAGKHIQGQQPSSAQLTLVEVEPAQQQALPAAPLALPQTTAATQPDPQPVAAMDLPMALPPSISPLPSAQASPAAIAPLPSPSPARSALPPSVITPPSLSPLPQPASLQPSSAQIMSPDPQQQNAAGQQQSSWQQLYPEWGGQSKSTTNANTSFNATTFNVQPPPPPDDEGTFKEFTQAFTVPRGTIDRWFDKRFATLQEYRWFRRINMFLLLLSTIAVGLTLHSWYMFALSLLALPIFYCCIRLVKPIFAGFLGGILALYWGWVAWVIVEPLNNSIRWFPPVSLVATLVFLIALFLHLRYIKNRLP
jgi:serine/threonine protein kinase